MMDVREKLVEILEGCDVQINGNVAPYRAYGIEEIADHLLAHGMTVQRWISVEERLPCEHDADADACVLAIHKASNKRYYHWRSVADNPHDFTRWMPTPNPPQIALEDVIDIDELDRRNNAAMRKVMDFLTDGVKEDECVG